MIARQEYFLGLSGDNPHGGQIFVYTRDFPTERNTSVYSRERKIVCAPKEVTLGYEQRSSKGVSAFMNSPGWYQHRVTITDKPVTLRYSVAIGLQHVLTTGKSRNQHEQL